MGDGQSCPSPRENTPRSPFVWIHDLTDRIVRPPRVLSFTAVAHSDDAAVPRRAHGVANWGRSFCLRSGIGRRQKLWPHTGSPATAGGCSAILSERHLPGGWSGGFQPPPRERAAGCRPTSRLEAGAPVRRRVYGAPATSSPAAPTPGCSSRARHSGGAAGRVRRHARIAHRGRVARGTSRG